MATEKTGSPAHICCSYSFFHLFVHSANVYGATTRPGTSAGGNGPAVNKTGKTPVLMSVKFLWYMHWALPRGSEPCPGLAPLSGPKGRYPQTLIPSLTAGSLASGITLNSTVCKLLTHYLKGGKIKSHFYLIPSLSFPFL